MIRPNMRKFHLYREVDVSGTSGTGIVAEGVEFTNGMCALSWLSSMHCVNIYANAKTIEQVHGHDGATRIVFEGSPNGE